MRIYEICFPLLPYFPWTAFREEQHVPSRSSDARCVPTAAQLAAAAPSSMPAPGRRMSSRVGPPWSSMVLCPSLIKCLKYLELPCKLQNCWLFCLANQCHAIFVRNRTEKCCEESNESSLPLEAGRLWMQLVHLGVHLLMDSRALPCSEEIFLLLKPGHYDILVPRDKSLRLLRLTGLGKESITW